MRNKNVVRNLGRGQLLRQRGREARLDDLAFERLLQLPGGGLDLGEGAPGAVVEEADRDRAVLAAGPGPDHAAVAPDRGRDVAAVVEQGGVPGGIAPRPAVRAGHRGGVERWEQRD